MKHFTIKILFMLVLGLTFQSKLYAHGDHSVPCSGPHKNDPGCDAPVVVLPPISVNSASIDWLNERIIIGGENFSADTTVTIAGISATIDSWTATQLEIPFDAAIAGILKGNHNLVASDSPSSSTSSLSLFVKDEIIDKATTGCPCATDWEAELGVALWTAHSTECFENSGGAGNPEDIAGTILTDPLDPAVYPQYPIGAAFTAEPAESVCQLTRVDSPLDPTSVTDLVKIRINRLQQANCRTVLATNVCNPITPVP